MTYEDQAAQSLRAAYSLLGAELLTLGADTFPAFIDRTMQPVGEFDHVQEREVYVNVMKSFEDADGNTITVDLNEDDILTGDESTFTVRKIENDDGIEQTVKCVEAPI